MDLLKVLEFMAAAFSGRTALYRLQRVSDPAAVGFERFFLVCELMVREVVCGGKVFYFLRACPV